MEKDINMSSKRRTFHVDWDSPSHETGTVKRRPTSLNTSVPISSNCFENVEYYEVKDCIGGYGLRLLKSFDSRLLGYENVVSEFFSSKRRSNEMEDTAIKDNGNGLEHPRSCATPCEGDTRRKNEDAEKFQDLPSNIKSFSEERNLPCNWIEETLSSSYNSLLENSNDTAKEGSTEFISKIRKHVDTQEDGANKIKSIRMEDSINSLFELTVTNDIDDSGQELSNEISKVNTKKNFDLKLYRESFEWKSKVSKVMKVSGAKRKLDTIKTKSLIPKARPKKQISSGRGLVNSSSESSGIGSPLSPLSPLKDTSTNVKDISATSIKSSGSKSSGFGSPDSPLSPESQKYTAFYLIEEQLEKLRNCPCEKRQARIYTDWANYYLERGGCKRRVTDLQSDLCDGVLLADLVEAVTNQKVIDVNRKPRNAQQMVENVSLCVGALRALGADVGSVNPGELAAGSTLWPVLALLFALSRYKQRAKQLQDMPRLPSPYNKQSAVGGAGGGPGAGTTSIPLPATVAATRRCPPDKVRPAPTPTHQSQLGGLKHGNGGIGSASSSRSTSPSQQQSPQSGLSFIPQPRNQNSTNRQPAATTPSPRTSTVGKPSGVRTAQQSPYATTGAPTQQNKNSVLDKFKLFNNKEKNQDRGKASSGVSKRTSSSSGFSSARSEHSDSSTSLCDQSKLQVESPKSRALKSKLQSTKPAKQASPKTVRKEQSKAQSKIARTKGAPDKLVGYNPPLEDVKPTSKIGGVAAKPAVDKKSSNLHDLLKQQPSSQLQKPNPSVLMPPKQIAPQDAKNFGSLKNDSSKQSPRPKMELPAKIPDTKVHLQNMKVPPNGLNKDVLAQKVLLSNTNGMIKQTEHEEIVITNENSSTIDHTLSMNQANLCDQKSTVEKQKEIGENVLTNNQAAPVENSNPSKQQNTSLPVKARIPNEVHETERINGKQTPPVSPRNSPEAPMDVKMASIQENPAAAATTHVNVPPHGQVSNALNFGANKQPPVLNSPLQGSTLGASGSPGSSIPKPTALVKGTSKPPKENNMPGAPTPTKLKADALHRKLDPNTVAMVSPMPSISDLMSESSHSNSNSTGQSNSSDSSVIYRPSSESGSEIKTIPNRKIDTTFEQMEKVLSESSTCGGGSMGDDEAEMTVKPMQPLLRGYTPGARALQTLPSRTTARQYTILHSSSHHHVGHDYADIDVASGYLSDGEVLRGGMTVGSRTISDLCDGYMSEGGASLYARRINPSYGHDHERYVGGSRRELSGVKELVTSRRVQKRPSANVVRSDGGCIGSSPGSGSVIAGGLLGGCSGGNDALAELTIEDLASIPAGNHTSANHTGHSSHHKRVPGGGGVIVGGGGNSATPQGAQQGSNLVYRVVSSRHPGHHPHVKKSDSSQQTDNSAFKHQQQPGLNSSTNSSSNSQQWKKYIEAGAARDRERDKEAAPPSPNPSRRSQEKHRKQAMAEYANGEKPQKVSSGTSTSGSSKVRGVPQSFGYVKRHSAGTSPSPNGVQNGGKDSTRTAQVSAVPRTKVKVSGGTQTCTTELQANSSASNQGHHYKSYSLTGPSASQLSQSVRDRLMLGSQSLPKPGSPEFTALFASAHHRERGSGAGPTATSFSPRVLKPSDGSLSDTCSNYAAPDLQGYYTPNSPYTTSWMRHSNTYTPSGRSQGMGLCEADSVESLGSHRASLTHARLLIHQRDSTGSPAPPRLNRSNSIRSTKSEKMYPSMLARGSGASSSVGEEVGVGIGMGVGVEPYYSVPVGSTGCTGQHWSQPTSPTPTHTSRQPPNLYQHVHKDDDIHGSSVSLVSTASSLYSSAEEKQAHELRKLRRELVDAQEKVHSLTSQLSTNVAVPWPPLLRQECQRLHPTHSKPSPMDLNVCSRRVHDGYATIRSRGRSRPRAVYRSDSEELLKEAGGPYALPRLSNFPIAPDDLQQVPRWTDFGKDCLLIENYGTLRGSKKVNSPDERKLVTMNTFSKADQGRSYLQNDYVQQTDDARVNGQGQLNTFSARNESNETKQDSTQNGSVDRLYDTVCTEECLNDRATLHSFRSKNDAFTRDDRLTDSFQSTVILDSNLKKLKEMENFVSNSDPIRRSGRRSFDIKKDDAKFKRPVLVDNKRISNTKDRQPIYAVPNILSKSRRDRRIAVVDGNYVPSGDLYRTTAKYIEDINKNIAEIDKSYEELKSSSNSKNSAYGVINKIAKGELDRSCNLYGYARKRDMAPMPPISCDFGENFDEKTEKQVDSDNKTECLDSTLIYKSRPNSFGKLPPKLLPRSSSIENTSRHSTGSTTTSSTKSTESLYAISETLTNEVGQNGELKSSLQNNTSKNPINCKQDPISTEGSDELESKDEMSSTDDDRPTIVRSVDRLPVTSSIRRNRSRVDSADRSYLKRDRILTVSKYDNIRRPNDMTEKNLYNSRFEAKLNDNNNLERRYDTLPSRRSRASSRPLHKSSEDVLDGERHVRVRSSSLHRPCTSNIDVSDRNDESFDRRKNFENFFNSTRALPFYLMDATDLILHGQIDRTSRSFQRQDHFLRSSYGRTRHNSLESEEPEDKDNDDNCRHSGFATLPRRGNLSKDQASNDPLRRLSGNVPILEPLYEHAVSDPVKPRSTENIIPWWELATRKYRHRSCPSLQAHVVSAFEQSLSNMTQRLQQLTATAEKKDSELQELRETIERLRKQSAEAGLNNGPPANNGRRHTLGDSDSGTTGCTGNSNHQGASMARQLSADSVTSLNSLSSACSASSHHKKKGWLRSSFSKAFSRSRKNRHGSVSDAEDCKESASGDLSAPNSPRLPSASKHDSSRAQGTRSNGQKSPEVENPLTGSKSSSALYKKEDEDVVELKKQLREKDLVLTDIRLEALSSAHQLESLKDTVIKMRNEMLNLKQNNERLQRLVTSKSLTSSQSSLPSDPDRRFSMTEVASTVAALSNGDTSTTADQLEDLNVPEHPVVPSTTSTTGEPTLEQDTDGKRINVAIYLGSEKNFNYNLVTGSTSDGSIGEPPHCIIASVCISNKTTWDSLDSTVRRCFKEYVSRVDPVTNLGLGVECVAAYHLGEASRCTTDSQHPELLPCGYLIGHVKTIYLVLSGYSWLAVDTLIPRSIVQRLISLLTEHRRVILCGPSGTGKSYLAGKLAHALVDADNDTKDATAVATFNVDHKSSKELRQYLAHIAERCDSNAADELPRVIILENLQHAASLGELFSGLLGTRHSSCPAIIGTMSQATCSTTNLQLHHNFRWVLCANHMEPVKGFLGRYLRRKLLEHELRECGGTRNAEMAAVVEWLPRVWLHLNKFLETHSSSDVTIGPRLFLSCPMEVTGSQVWFTDLWNYSVVPYLVEAVREGLTLYGRRVSGNGNGDSSWEDPAQFITSSYPWISTHAVHGGSDALLRLRPEDVGYDVVTSGHTSGVGASSVKSLGSTHSDTEGDPLLNMLMRLQEAANYSSPHSNDSDSVTSLDSSHTRQSEDLSSSTSSSRGVESAL